MTTTLYTAQTNHGYKSNVLTHNGRIYFRPYLPQPAVHRTGGALITRLPMGPLAGRYRGGGAIPPPFIKRPSVFPFRNSSLPQRDGMGVKKRIRFGPAPDDHLDDPVMGIAPNHMRKAGRGFGPPKKKIRALAGVLRHHR